MVTHLSINHGLGCLTSVWSGHSSSLPSLRVILSVKLILHSIPDLIRTKNLLGHWGVLLLSEFHYHSAMSDLCEMHKFKVFLNPFLPKAWLKFCQWQFVMEFLICTLIRVPVISVRYICLIKNVLCDFVWFAKNIKYTFTVFIYPYLHL